MITENRESLYEYFVTRMRRAAYAGSLISARSLWVLNTGPEFRRRPKAYATWPRSLCDPHLPACIG